MLSQTIVCAATSPGDAASELSQDLSQNVAFAKDLDVLAVDFHFASAVLAVDHDVSDHDRLSPAVAVI